MGFMYWQLLKECGRGEESHEDLQGAQEMVQFQLRHGNDLLAMDSLRDCDVRCKVLRLIYFLVSYNITTYESGYCMSYITIVIVIHVMPFLLGEPQGTRAVAKARRVCGLGRQQSKEVCKACVLVWRFDTLQQSQKRPGEKGKLGKSVYFFLYCTNGLFVDIEKELLICDACLIHCILFVSDIGHIPVQA